MTEGQTMSLTDQLHQARHEQRKGKGPRCAIGKVIAKASDDDRTALQDALNADPDEWPASAIAKALNVGEHTVRRHRRGACSCGRIGVTP